VRTWLTVRGPPTVLSLSIWVGFSWGCLYGLVEAIPLIYENIYGWEIGNVGLAFISVVLGAFLGWGLNRFQEKAYKRLRELYTSHQRVHHIQQLISVPMRRPYKRDGSKTLVLDDWRSHLRHRKHDIRLGYSRPLDWTTDRRDTAHQRNLLYISGW
jgi:hypothetical protein